MTKRTFTELSQPPEPDTSLEAGYAATKTWPTDFPETLRTVLANRRKALTAVQSRIDEYKKMLDMNIPGGASYNAITRLIQGQKARLAVLEEDIEGLQAIVSAQDARQATIPGT